MEKEYVPEMEMRLFLSAGETDAEGRMSLPHLVSMLIEIATAHANSLNIGNPSMESLGCGWVLSRLSVDMREYPHVNSEYILSTWVEEWNRHYSERCFALRDSEGGLLGSARSIWMVLSTATRESVGLGHLHLPEGIVSPGRHGIPKDPRLPKRLRVAEVKEGEPVPPGAIAANAPAIIHRFGYSDLDFYRHVNTVRYVSFLLNQYTLEEFDRSQVSRLEMQFMHELHAGEDIRVEQYQEGSRRDFSFYLPDGSPAFFSRMLLTYIC